MADFPCVDLSEDPRGLERGTEQWSQLCRKVCEALQIHGWLLVKYDKIPESQHDEMFAAVPPLFDLPVETKSKSSTSDPFAGYVAKGSPSAPLYETLAVVNAAGDPNKWSEFTRLMWPEGSDAFCKSVGSMSSKLLELDHLLTKMIFDGLGVGNHYEEVITEQLDTLFRMIKYDAPHTEESVIGVPPHCDGSFLSILFQNEVQGLEVQPNEGEEGLWAPVTPPKGSFVVMVGQALMAWSNGRLRATLHQVTMNGDKPRFSCGHFSMPKKELIVEAPRELVDDKHPARFRPFKYIDFLAFAMANASMGNKIEIYAGV